MELTGRQPHPQQDHNNTEETMNYLTNYYKNLCEQRQEQIRLLEQQLNEISLRDVPEIARNILNIPTDGKISRGLGTATAAIGRGVKKAGDFVSSMGSKVQGAGEEEVRQSRQYDVPARAQETHDDIIHGYAQSAIRRIPQFTEDHMADIRNETGGDPDSGVGISQEAIEAHAKKRGNKGKTRAQLAIELKRQKIADAEATIPSRNLGRIAAEINAASMGDIQRRQEETTERKERLGGTGELFWRPNDTPRGVREHHGGHGPHMAHPEISRLRGALAERDIQIPRDVWARLSHHSTFHVDQQFEGLLDKKLRKLNNAGQAAFAQAVAGVQAVIDDHDRKQTTASDLRSNAPFKMMESKKHFLNNKINFLLENEDDSYDVDFGDDDSVDLDAPNEDDEPYLDKSAIDNVTNMIDNGLGRIWDASDHPKITDEHKRKLNDIDSMLTSYAEGLKFSRDPDEIASYHQDVQDALDQIEDIHDSLGPHGEEKE